MREFFIREIPFLMALEISPGNGTVPVRSLAAVVTDEVFPACRPDYRDRVASSVTPEILG